MPYDPQKHHRRSIRLKGYDYSQAGLYFITTCVQNRKYLFGKINNGEMILNDAGKMIETEWLDLKNRFPNIELHEFVVMPNHFHSILEIQNTPVRAPLVGALGADAQDVDIRNNGDNETQHSHMKGQQGLSQQKTVGDMMDAFKSITTVEYIRGVKQMGWQPFDGKLWQRNYYEHIIRNEAACQRIVAYIINNPVNWDKDKFST
ncbi:transposase [Limibacter armeniacum]|uniref:transposase n=1 Tax=Limibacter armeniacum TaxID=466084 RepID=UPI002FE6A13F